tara:strand:- start:433 stop:906 length:474 start_codon:yes stop_codon:yes gene_type:complete
MIITCENCTKKFEVDADLIPDKGRLLQCMKCQHTWFFKNAISIDTDKSVDFNSPTLMEDTSGSEKDDLIVENNLHNQELSENKNKKWSSFTRSNLGKKKRISIINLTLVFIISFIALIILTDTFKSQIGKIVPSVDFLLYNLYESIKDILLFINDLI